MLPTQHFGLTGKRWTRAKQALTAMCKLLHKRWPSLTHWWYTTQVMFLTLEQKCTVTAHCVVQNSQLISVMVGILNREWAPSVQHVLFPVVSLTATKGDAPTLWWTQATKRKHPRWRRVWLELSPPSSNAVRCILFQPNMVMIDQCALDVFWTEATCRSRSKTANAAGGCNLQTIELAHAKAAC